MRSRWILLVLAASGCLDMSTADPAQPEAAALVDTTGMPRSDGRSPPAPMNAPSLKIADAQVTGLQALEWQGEALESPALVDPDECQPGACQAIRFTVDAPASHWTQYPGHLEVALRWDPSLDAELDLLVRNSAGTILARGEKAPGASEFRPVAERSISHGTVAFVPSPTSGTYSAEIRAVHGAAAYVGSLQYEYRWPAPATPLPLLPNLRVRPAFDLGFDHPGDPFSEVWGAATGTRGCSFDEAHQAGVERCLRMSTIFENVGEGPLELRIAGPEVVDAFLGTAPVRQRIYATDGSYEERVSGTAEFHAEHHHFHFTGIAQHWVHRYDPETGRVGDAVSEARKIGFCVMDIGLADPAASQSPSRPSYGPGGCFGPTVDGDFVMGISPGWFDLYWWQLADQYVPLDGLQDGDYALVSRIDPDLALTEANEDDNEAAVFLRVQGSEVTVLGSA